MPRVPPVFPPSKQGPPRGPDRPGTKGHGGPGGAPPPPARPPPRRPRGPPLSSPPPGPPSCNVGGLYGFGVGFGENVLISVGEGLGPPPSPFPCFWNGPQPKLLPPNPTQLPPSMKSKWKNPFLYG